MIEVRIDTGRIKQLAPLHLQTIIAEEGPSAAIVAPSEGEFRSVAERGQAELAARVGVELPLLDEASFDGAQELPGNVIAVGSAACNQLLRALHYRRRLSDADYPTDGHRALSIHDPFGDGHSVLVALGATPDVAERSVARIVDRVAEEDGRWLVDGRVFEVEPRPETPDPEELLQDSSQRDAASLTGWPRGFLTALDHLNAGGEKRWARAFVELIAPYATGEIPLSFWLMSAVDFWTDRLVVGWERAEAFSYFTDDERLLVANFIASCTEYCHDSATYQKWRVTDEELQIFNHHTYPATGLFWGCAYLRRHGYEIADLDAWLNKAKRVFDRASESGRSFDEGGAGYSWIVGNHILEIALAQADTDYIRSPKMIQYADLAVVIQNNRFEMVPFGDCGSYHVRGGGAATVLLRAAEWHDEPGYKWVAEQAAPEVVAANILTRDLPSEPPEKHLGLFVLPLDPVVYRWIDLPRFPNYPPPPRGVNVPVGETFDKISLRGGWGEDDDYLLLQGFGDGQHGHPDSNAISQYQVRGRLLLADNDYIRRMPKQHNMVMVIKDGQHAPIPVTARLDAAQEFPGGAITQTTLVDYNGCDWQRTLLWLSADCAVVIDSLTAREAGDYELRCYWRTLGDAELTDDGLLADHDGERFRVIELTDSERRLSIEELPLSATAYPEYNFGDARPKVLRETRAVRLEAGDEAVFVNLLLPNGGAEAPRRCIRWEGNGRIETGGDGPLLRVTPDGFQVGDGELQAFPSDQRLTALESPVPALAPRPAILPPMEATQQWTASLPAPATCLARADGDRILVGCEDGQVLELGDEGAIRELAQTEGRVGAVLAGRLYGEEEVTYLATGWDSRLRLLTPKGDLRQNIELPRNSHMPAWGRALCLADLDGDGRLWPMVGTAAWRVHAVTPDGEMRWTFDTAAHSVTCISAADLSGDGRDDIAVGTVYFCIPAITSDGERLWADEDYNDYWSAGPNFPYLATGDVDGDGDIEVIGAGSDTLVHCVSHCGEKKWTYSIGDDPAGLVLLPSGVVAASETGDLHCIDGNGSAVWRLALGSPCTALCEVGGGVAVATEAGDVVWVDGAGEIERSVRLDAPASHLLGGPDGMVTAATASGAVVRLV